ncbi:hypothetical protein Tco_1336143 [Tanacetum coccineum]
MTKNLEEYRRTQKGSSSTEGSKLDRGYVGRASTIQATRSLDFGFEDQTSLKVYNKVEKGSYGFLHQAPKSLSMIPVTYLLGKNMVSEWTDRQNLFIKGTKVDYSDSNEMDDGNFVSHEKYVTEDFEAIWLSDVQNHANTPMIYCFAVWIYIDNKSTICIVKNPVFHSKTKHIEIRHHFIKDSNEKKLIQMIKIHTNKNVADFLTKAFDDGKKDSLDQLHLISQHVVMLKEEMGEDEVVYKERGDSVERAATTASSLPEDRAGDSGKPHEYTIHGNTLMFLFLGIGSGGIDGPFYKNCLIECLDFGRQQKTAHAKEKKLASWKKRVKKLERKKKSKNSRTPVIYNKNHHKIITSNIKDKGIAKTIEPEKPLKKKEQIRLDEELAFKLQAVEEEQARLAREKAEKVKEANIFMGLMCKQG